MSEHRIRKPRTDDRALWDVVFGIYGYPAVLLAHKLKLFTLLGERPRTLAEISEALRIACRPAEAILTATVALGFMHLENGRYRLTPLSEDYLLESSPTYFGAYLDLIIGNYSVCSLESLERAVRTNSPQVYGGGDAFKSHEEQAELARAFTRGMHAVSMAHALAWPEAIDLSEHKIMLDIGGGSGAHCIGATLKWPSVKTIVFDLAPVCEVAAEMAARHGLQGRIGTQAGDMWTDPFPAADVHFYSNIYHDWPPEKCLFLTRKSFESLPSGGRIILHETLYNDEKTGPFAAAGFSMVMLAWVTGQQFSGRELFAMLGDAGFIDLEARPTFGYVGIVTGRKP